MRAQPPMDNPPRQRLGSGRQKSISLKALVFKSQTRTCVRCENTSPLPTVWRGRKTGKAQELTILPRIWEIRAVFRSDNHGNNSSMSNVDDAELSISKWLNGFVADPGSIGSILLRATLLLQSLTPPLPVGYVGFHGNWSPFGACLSLTDG